MGCMDNRWYMPPDKLEPPCCFISLWVWTSQICLRFLRFAKVWMPHSWSFDALPFGSLTLPWKIAHVDVPMKHETLQFPMAMLELTEGTSNFSPLNPNENPPWTTMFHHWKTGFVEQAAQDSAACGAACLLWPCCATLRETPCGMAIYQLSSTQNSCWFTIGRATITWPIATSRFGTHPMIGACTPIPFFCLY